MEVEMLLIAAISAILIILLMARFAGFNNSRCYSPRSEQCQGRLRLDDCNDLNCHKIGRCKWERRM